MITRNEILETNSMISDMNLDVRTITMGISLLDCADADINKFNEKVYKKITTYAKDLVKVGDELAKEYGVPVVREFPLHPSRLRRQAAKMRIPM